MTRCTFKQGNYNCGSYAFNLYKEDIEQGSYCDRHYWQDQAQKARADEREACAELVWPKLKIWSEEEQTAMGLAFNKAQEKHGWYETLMAVGASVLKMKAAAIRARGQT
jgi:hypothetical protein